MKQLLQRVIQAAAYTAAGLIILLAIAVGLFRLFLPRLPEYQDDIKSWASDALGMQVEFAGMDARWGLRGPELKFYRAELVRPGNQTRMVAADEVGVGVSLLRLLIDQALVVDTVTVSDTSVEIRQVIDGSWQVQGSPVDELMLLQGRDGDSLRPITVIGQDIEVQVIRPGDERPRFFQVGRVIGQLDDVRIAIDANIQLPESLGGELTFSATQISVEGGEAPWNLQVETDALDLGELSQILPDGARRFASGAGEIDLSLAFAGRRIVSASSQFAFENVSLGDATAFDIRGRVAINNDDDGWLIAADNFSIRTGQDEWPSSSPTVQASVDEQRNIVMLDVDVPYVDLDIIELLLPWLGDEHAELLNRWRPDGVLRNFELTLGDLDQDSPLYQLSSELQRAGVAAQGRVPGVRGFSGSIQASNSGGQLQIQSSDAVVDMSAWVSDPIPVASAIGTFIWVNSGPRTTIVSDNVAIDNDFFSSQSNIQVSIIGDSSPVIDLRSTWSIEDLASAKRFIPETIMHPKLFLWFQDALVAGRVPSGETELHGQLDKFPFDGGEGQLLLEANVRDLVFRYARQFPLTDVSDMDVVLENSRLYTERNRSISLGNSTVDAQVEIADLRKPVLQINSFSTGTLNSVQRFAANSPIGRVFGGQLDRVTVDGDASVTLDLTIPLLDWRSFEFTSRIQSTNGTMAIRGLRPVLTELSGAVTIQRDLVSSESLGASFLGEPVSIELRNATADMEEFRVVAAADGSATGAAIAEAFALPLVDHLDGRSEYRAEILFPRAGNENPAPLTVRVETDLAGLAVDLPPPFEKSADELRPLSGELLFMPGGEQITTRGRSGDIFAWDFGFASLDGVWDFDRGVLMLGNEPLPSPEVRGMHIRGQTALIRLDDWLVLSRGEDAEINAAERIRSVDLVVDDLYLLGQRLKNHRVKVDRSARDWLVQFDGDEVSGSVFVPYDFSADRAIVLDMERLVLPGDDDADRIDSKPSPDPRSLPAIALKAKEFGLGERMFGEVVADFTKTPGGLSADSIVAKDATFDIVGSARWVANDADPMGSRTALTATLTSRNVEQTMRRLNFQPGIVSEDMGVLMDVNWSGGPRMDFLDTLDGEVQVRFGSGQLEEVDPGAGRVFGLMSVVELPRRLSLDFRDVFQKGFGFDKISGTFRLVKGTAYTCNLSLEGPAADIGIIGRTDISNKDYEQTAVVSTNVGNIAPVVTAFAAGPQAAAAVFLFSQIFKEPLEDIGTIYYTVTGSWDEPQIEAADEEAFAKSGELAGCLDNTE